MIVGGTKQGLQLACAPALCGTAAEKLRKHCWQHLAACMFVVGEGAL